MAINRVDVTVRDNAALTQLHVSELIDGCWAYVIDEQSYFTLIKNGAGFTPDGVTVKSIRVVGGGVLRGSQASAEVCAFAAV